MIFQIAIVERLFSIGLSQLIFIDHGENHSINNDGFKNFRYIKSQRITSVAWLVEKTDSRIKLGSINFRQDGGVNKGIAKESKN